MIIQVLYSFTKLNAVFLSIFLIVSCVDSGSFENNATSQGTEFSGRGDVCFSLQESPKSEIIAATFAIQFPKNVGRVQNISDACAFAMHLQAVENQPAFVTFVSIDPNEIDKYLESCHNQERSPPVSTIISKKVRNALMISHCEVDVPRSFRYLRGYNRTTGPINKSNPSPQDLVSVEGDEQNSSFLLETLRFPSSKTWPWGLVRSVNGSWRVICLTDQTVYRSINAVEVAIDCFAKLKI